MRLSKLNKVVLDTGEVLFLLKPVNAWDKEKLGLLLSTTDLLTWCQEIILVKHMVIIADILNDMWSYHMPVITYVSQHICLGPKYKVFPHYVVLDNG